MDTPPACLTLDAGNTRVVFSVRWFGIIPVRGTFTSLRGTVTVPGGVEGPVIVLEVDSASVHTGIALRDRHLRGPRFLGSSHHAVIRFESRSITRHDGTWHVRGRLALRGLDRDVSLVVPDEPTGSTQALAAEFAVPRAPHAIGAARGLRRLNPLLWAIGATVSVRVEVVVPVTLLRQPSLSARAR